MNLLETMYQILLDRSAVDAYIYNYTNASSLYKALHKNPSSFPLFNAFFWASTPEGDMFWRSITDKLFKLKSPHTPRQLYEYCINRHNQKDEYEYW